MLSSDILPVWCCNSFHGNATQQARICIVVMPYVGLQHRTSMNSTYIYFKIPLQKEEVSLVDGCTEKADGACAPPLPPLKKKHGNFIWWHTTSQKIYLCLVTPNLKGWLVFTRVKLKDSLFDQSHSLKPWSVLQLLVVSQL